MSFSKWGQIIRTQQDDFCSLNIYAAEASGTLKISLESYRTKSEAEPELFLFLKWKDDFYYPLCLEFRSLNNNLLFLIEEFHINSFNQLRIALQKSMEKEGKKASEMKALVYHPRQEPRFAHLLKNFKIEKDHSVEIYEKP